jgi:hypothetical protein
VIATSEVVLSSVVVVVPSGVVVKFSDVEMSSLVVLLVRSAMMELVTSLVDSAAVEETAGVVSTATEVDPVAVRPADVTTVGFVPESTPGLSSRPRPTAYELYMTHSIFVLRKYLKTLHRGVELQDATQSSIETSSTALRRSAGVTITTRLHVIV